MNTNNFQQQIQQQMQDQQRRMQMAAWAKQQEEAKRAHHQQVAEDEWRNRLRRVELEATRLRAEREAGHLDDKVFKTRLHDLMVQDGSGAWWMIDSRTSQWFRNSGADWYPSDPTRVAATTFRPEIAVSPHRLRAIAVLVFGLVATGALAFFAGHVVFESTHPHQVAPANVAAGSVSLLGLIFTWRSARRRWRGY